MRLGSESEKMHFFGVCDTPSWQLDIIDVVKGDRQSAAVMSIGMSRLTGFYISNIAIPCYLIGTGAVLTLGINPSDYANRFQCMISLFLTLVAIKFVAQFLPVISYSTLLDRYTLCCYVFLASWMIENFIVSDLFFSHDDHHVVYMIDKCAAVCYVSLWTILHLTIWYGEKHDIFRKSWKDVLEDDQAGNPDTHKECDSMDSNILDQ
jgi:hypothetical protein